jgi:hypothetical protein
LMNQMPKWHHPLLKNRRFRQVTHDRFFLVVERRDPKFADPRTRQFLEAAGSIHIEEVDE